MQIEELAARLLDLEQRAASVDQTADLVLRLADRAERVEQITVDLSARVDTIDAALDDLTAITTSDTVAMFRRLVDIEDAMRDADAAARIGVDAGREQELRDVLDYLRATGHSPTAVAALERGEHRKAAPRQHPGETDDDFRERLRAAVRAAAREPQTITKGDQ